jgi:hypothetical protein
LRIHGDKSQNKSEVSKALRSKSTKLRNWWSKIQRMSALMINTTLPNMPNKQKEVGQMTVARIQELVSEC